MKLTKEQLKNLIKEEATKIRKEMELEKVKSSKKAQLEVRKTEIMSQLNEMYGEDVNEILGFGAKANEDSFRKNSLNKINIWATKGYAKPTPQEFEAIVAAAKADGFNGILGVDGAKKIIYKPSKNVKWATEFSGGGNGGTNQAHFEEGDKKEGKTV